MFSFSLVVSCLLVAGPAHSVVLKLYQETWEMEKQCVELIKQHALTYNQPQVELDVKTCIAFLKKENIKHQEDHTFGEVETKIMSINNQAGFTEPRHVPEQSDILNGKLESSEVTGKGYYRELIESDIKKSQENIINLLIDDFKEKSSEGNDIIGIYPENIVQEWPAVEMARKKRGLENNQNTGRIPTVKQSVRPTSKLVLNNFSGSLQKKNKVHPKNGE